MRFIAGRGAVADRLVRGAALAELLLAGNRRHRGLLAGTLWRSCCWPGCRCGARAPSMYRCRCGASWQADRGAVAEQGRRQCESAAAEQGRRQYAGIAAEHERLTKCRRRCGARALARSTSGQQNASAAARQGRWQKARAGAGRQILSDSPSDLAITSAAQVLPYVFTAVRGISQSC